jgi:hypothetical protein
LKSIQKKVVRKIHSNRALDLAKQNTNGTLAQKNLYLKRKSKTLLQLSLLTKSSREPILPFQSKLQTI